MNIKLSIPKVFTILLVSSFICLGQNKELVHPSLIKLDKILTKIINSKDEAEIKQSDLADFFKLLIV